MTSELPKYTKNGAIIWKNLPDGFSRPVTGDELLAALCLADRVAKAKRYAVGARLRPSFDADALYAEALVLENEDGEFIKLSDVSEK